MKIALMSLNYTPSTGGLVTYLKSLSRYLSEQHDVHVFCVKERGFASADIEVLDGVTIHRIDALPKNLFSKLFGPLIISLKIKKELQKQHVDQYDLIICRHFYFAFAVSQLRISNVNFLMPLVAPRLVWINTEKLNIVSKLAMLPIIAQTYFLEKSAVKSGIDISVLSNSKKSEVEHFYNVKNVDVTSPGYNAERFNTAGRIKNNVFTMLSVARLVEEKNIELVIDAVDYLIMKFGISLQYIIVGDGPLREQLEGIVISRKLENWITFVGDTQQPERFYKQADLFVLCSKYEGFGHVYIEANACGVPVIGLANGVNGSITACNEIIVNGVNGFLLFEDNCVSLANLIKEKIIESSQDFVTKSSSYVHEKYSWQKHFLDLCNFSL